MCSLTMQYNTILALITRAYSEAESEAKCEVFFLHTHVLLLRRHYGHFKSNVYHTQTTFLEEGMC